MPDGYITVFTATAGFSPTKTSGDEVYGDCPLCGSENKFYVNSLTGLWSCKKCGKEGNLYDWLETWLDYCDHNYAGNAPWEALAKDRSIPVNALQDSGLAWDGSRWLLPVVNLNGTVVSLHSYQPPRQGKKSPLMVVEGLKSALYGLDLLADAPKNCVIYLCEGPWDAIALWSEIKDSGVVLAVPSAGTLKREWVDYFAGHPVVICYDNDQAGLSGAKKAISLLSSVSQSIQQIIWPDTAPTGYDVRDHFTDGKSLTGLLGLISRPELDEDAGVNLARVFKPFGSMDFNADVLPIFRAWLEITPDIETAIRIAYATVLSNQIPGESVWLQLVAPPGGAKTEILRAAGSVANTMFLSTLRPASLVSGWAKGDASVLPKLKDKTLVIRDLTEVLSDSENNQRAVFSILRQAYDGEVYYSYGQNVVRHYADLRFSILAGVTPEIFANPMASLGERFLVYHFFKGADFDDTSLVQRAASSSGMETPMREALSEITKEYLESKIESDQVPDVPEWFEQRLIYLAKLTAKLRGNVRRSPRHDDVILYPPQHELGTRLVKQLTHLAVCLAMLEPGAKVNERVYSIVKRVALDSCAPFKLQLVNFMFEAHAALPIETLCDKANLPRPTVQLHLDDMRRLHAITSKQQAIKGATKVVYEPSESIRLFWNRAILATRNGHGLKPTEFKQIVWRKKAHT